MAEGYRKRGDGMAKEDACSASWRLRSEFGQEKIVTAELARLLTQQRVRAERREEVVTAVGEACLNALEHGNRLDGDRPVEVRMIMTGPSCTFRIYDEGSGFDFSPLPEDQAARHGQADPRGWGLLFISSFADRIRVGAEAGRFYVELMFRLYE